MERSMIKKVLLACIGFVAFVAMMANVLQSQEENAIPIVAQDEEKIAYITFDDGPSKNTEEILNILDQHQVKATFFVTGTSEDYVSMIKEEANRGHAIGIHTYSHDYKDIYSSVDNYFKDLEKANQMIQDQTGMTSNIMRFPGGTSNTISKKYSSGIMSELAKRVVDKGYSYYDWNSENGDGNSHLSADTLIQTAKKSIKGKNTLMMLMHDGAGNQATVASLPAILEELKTQGYEFRVIDADTPVFHHHIAN